MTDIIIPVGVRIAKFKELTPGAQEKLLEIIDYAYDVRGMDKRMSPDQWRKGMIDLLECGEACVERVPGGVALVLTGPQSDFLM